MLRVDLLPRVIVRGRRNAQLLVFCIFIILAAAVAMLLMLKSVQAKVADTEQKLADAKQRADAVRATEAETAAKKAELAPIQAKIDFVDAADQSGEPYFDRFWKINEYIYSRAKMTDFQITPPSSVSFTVELGDTTDVGRFLLNLVLCPHINGIQVSGVPAGESVAPSDQVQQPITSETITLSVTATLAEAITVPTVPGAGGGAAPGAPGAMGPEGMMPGEPGMGGPGPAEPGTGEPGPPPPEAEADGAGDV